MKKIYFLLIVVMITIIATKKAVSQSGQKWATDGNTTSNTDFIGTKNWSPMIFKTNNTEKFRITPYGFVGGGLTILGSCLM